ncbi:MAG: hypothetical protein WCO58_03400 [bacterium]
MKIVRPRKIDGEKPEDEEKYNVMIEKRAYDVLGSFLPAGAKTNASCHMNLRQFDDKLSYMKYHPLPEIKALADSTLEALVERYPSTFEKKKMYQESEDYRKYFQDNFAYNTPPLVAKNKGEIFVFTTNFIRQPLIAGMYRELLSMRPKMTEVPKIVNEVGSFLVEFTIDFRSHRDLQRQRSALQRVPLLTTDIGFEPWYLDQLPESVFNEAIELLAYQQDAIALLDCDDLTRQYYIAMGYKVSNTFTIPFADLIYIIELRTATTVHPTARKIALNMYEGFKKALEDIGVDFVKIHAVTDTDDFDIKRADQDLFLEGKRLSDKGN